MEWNQIYTIIGANILLALAPFASMIALFLFSIKSSRDDYSRLETKLDAWRTESMALMREIQEEMKSFHNRMCALEEKRKSKQ